MWVSSPDKVGLDAGKLAGLDRELGVAATNDADALLALRPDCIVHTAWADDRLFEALADLERFLRAGINVVSSSPVFLQYPRGAVPEAMYRRGEARGRGRGVAVRQRHRPRLRQRLAAAGRTGICERIDEVRCMEILNYATYDQPTVLFDIMGFGGPLDEVPFILSPGILTTAWGSVVSQIAAGLDVELDEIVEWHERVPAPEAFDVASGRIEAGTTAGMRFEVRGMVGGRPVVVLEHVTRLRDDLAPDWPQPTGPGRLPGRAHRRAQLHARPADAGQRRRPQHGRAQGHGHAPGQRGPGRGGRRGRAQSRSTSRWSRGGAWSPACEFAAAARELYRLSAWTTRRGARGESTKERGRPRRPGLGAAWPPRWRSPAVAATDETPGIPQSGERITTTSTTTTAESGGTDHEGAPSRRGHRPRPPGA